MSANVVAVFRVKNEARWAKEAIETALEVADMAIVLDDHSSDGTPTIAGSTSERVMVYESTFDTVDERRDRQFIYEKALAYGAKWVVATDGDEALTLAAIKEMRTIVKFGVPGAYFFRVAYLWDAADQERVDGVYADIRVPALFSADTTKSYLATGHGANLHCGRAPNGYAIRQHHKAAAVIKHYGYLYAEDRQKKYEFYNRTDTVEGREREGGYEHVIGRPSKWASGPLQLRKFDGK